MSQNKVSNDKYDFYFAQILKNGKHEIYNNPYNLPEKNILDTKKYREPIFRFCFDSKNNELYIQDENWMSQINSGDKIAHEFLNFIVGYLRNKHGKQEKRQIRKKYGNPIDLIIKNKLSDYSSAWKEISWFFNEEYSSDPINIDVLEYESSVENPDNSVITFHKNGFNRDENNDGSPVFSINKTKLIDEEGVIDYEKINNLLTIVGIENILNFNNVKSNKSVNQSIFFAANRNGKTRIFEINEEQSNYLQSEEALKESIRRFKCNDCETIGSGYNKSCKKCDSKDVSHLPFDDWDITIFSYNTNTKNILIKTKEINKQTIHKIKYSISNKYKDELTEIRVSFDPLVLSPFLTKIRKYRPVWTYIEDVCHRNNIDSEEIDVFEAPIPVKNGVSDIIFNKEQEDQNTGSDMKKTSDYKIGLGIEIQYPYIIVDSRCMNHGKRLKGIIDSYLILLSKLNGKTIESTIPSNDRIKDIVICLIHSMSKTEILDMFCAENETYLRYQYLKLISKSEDIYNKLRKTQSVTNTSVLKKSASFQLPVVLDWWGINNEEKNQNNFEKIDMSDFKQLKSTIIIDGTESLEGMVSKQHDKEFGYMKSIEMLLEESRI